MLRVCWFSGRRQPHAPQDQTLTDRGLAETFPLCLQTDAPQSSSRCHRWLDISAVYHHLRASFCDHMSCEAGRLSGLSHKPLTWNNNRSYSDVICLSTPFQHKLNIIIILQNNAVTKTAIIMQAFSLCICLGVFGHGVYNMTVQLL